MTCCMGVREDLWINGQMNVWGRDDSVARNGGWTSGRPWSAGIATVSFVRGSEFESEEFQLHRSAPCPSMSQMWSLLIQACSTAIVIISDFISIIQANLVGIISSFILGLVPRARERARARAPASRSLGQWVQAIVLGESLF